MKVFAAGFALLLVVLLVYLPVFGAPVIPMDEGLLLVYPELISKGKLPYRDFETFYAPGNINLLAGVYAVFGADLMVERIVGLGYRLAMLGGVFAFARRWGAWCAFTVALVAAAFSFIPSLTAFAWFGGLAAMIWSLVLLGGESEKPSRIVAAGLLAGIAVLFRQDLGLAVLLAPLPLLWRFRKFQRWQFVGGFAVGVSTFLFYAAVLGIRVLIDSLFIYPVLICGPGRKLPLTFEPPGAAGIVLLHGLACALNLMAAILAVKRDGGAPGSRLFLSMAVLGICLTPQALQRADYPHVAMSVFLSVALVPISIITLLRSIASTPARHAILGASGSSSITRGGDLPDCAQFRSPCRHQRSVDRSHPVSLGGDRRSEDYLWYCCASTSAPLAQAPPDAGQAWRASIRRRWRFAKGVGHSHLV